VEFQNNHEIFIMSEMNMNTHLGKVRTVGAGEGPTEACAPREQLSTLAVSESSAGVAIQNKVQCEFFNDAVPQAPMEPGISTLLKKKGDADISSVKFSEEIKIDFIPVIDYRILCRFLGLSSVNDVKNTPFTDVPLITFMVMESTGRFMESIGYNFAGELNFNREGMVVPVHKNPWILRGKEICFTIHGFQYYENQNGNRNDNIVFFFYTDLDQGGSSITCFGNDLSKCKSIIQNLRDYTKSHNCLRGAKLRDLNTISATFEEVEDCTKYSWENYYYSDDVKKLFELEVFGFLHNIKKYNSHGIKRRGLMLTGPAGCVISGTKIKIRKKKKEGKHSIITI
jgi:hypothetical protein